MTTFRRLLIVLSILSALLVAPALSQASVGANYYASGYVVPADHSGSAAAWHWYSGWGWWRQDRVANDRVWIQAYGSGWMWTWSTSTGWLAMHSTDLDANPVPAATVTTGASGKVTYGPLCPVEPCAATQQPVTLHFALTSGLNPPTDVTTAADGTYSVRLSPGYYSVSANIGFRSVRYVTIAPSGMTTINLSFDTGIR